MSGFIKGSQKLIFGKNAGVIKDNRIATVQTFSGTGALRTGFDFIKEYFPKNVVIPEPTWPNHERIIRHAGVPISFYQYYDHTTKKVDLKGIVNSL